MSRVARVFALIGLIGIAAGGPASAHEAPQPEAPKGVADMLDASRLPRMAGAQEMFAGKSTAAFIVLESVPQAAEATRALLAAEGWQPRAAPVAANAPRDMLAIMNFQKGGQGLNVFVTVAPAQGGATAIQYTPIAIENDPPPLPKSATNIAGAPVRLPARAAQGAPARPANPAAEGADLRDLPRLAGAEERG